MIMIFIRGDRVALDFPGENVKFCPTQNHYSGCFIGVKLVRSLPPGNQHTLHHISHRPARLVLFHYLHRKQSCAIKQTRKEFIIDTPTQPTKNNCPDHCSGQCWLSAVVLRQQPHTADSLLKGKSCEQVWPTWSNGAYSSITWFAK